MTRFFTDEKITLNSLEDITRRPAYAESVPPRRSLFRQVLATYSFPRKIAACAVSDCYQNHKKGFLVRTSEGGECSICDSCARRFLDPEALKPPRAARRSSAGATGSAGRSAGRGPAAAPTTRQIDAETFSAESGTIRERVKALQQAEQGANWLFRMSSQFHKQCPAELKSALDDLRQHGEEGATFASLIDSNASDGQLQDIEQLQGLEVLTGDIRNLLMERILKPLTKLDQKAGSAAAGQGVRVPVQWADEVEACFIQAEQLIEAGRLFFSPDNIARLRSIPLPDPAAQAVRALCQQLITAEPQR